MSLQSGVASTSGGAVDILALVTAEAWLDPDFSSRLERDKVEAITRFARRKGLAAPNPGAIDAFELPESPVGDLIDGPAFEAADVSYGCITRIGCDSTANTGCAPTAGCPTQAVCPSVNTCPTQACPSVDCPTTTLCPPTTI